MEGERNIAPPGFKEVSREPLLDINPTSELWLIQLPLNHAYDLDDGQELSLKLHGNGLLGNFQGSSGKSYEVVSMAATNPNATVFLSSAAAEPKIVGKISRQVSLVHYPEPSELQKQNPSYEKRRQLSGTSFTNSSLGNRTQSSKQRSSKSTFTHSSRDKSPLSESRKLEKRRKRKSSDEKTRSTSAVTSSGSLGHVDERKSKKSKKG